MQILAAIYDAESSMAGRTGTPRGLLRLTVPDAFGRLVMLPLLKKFLATWPDVQVEVSFTDRQADIIEEGFDLAVRIGGASPDTRRARGPRHARCWRGGVGARYIGA